VAVPVAGAIAASAGGGPTASASSAQAVVAVTSAATSAGVTGSASASVSVSVGPVTGLGSSPGLSLGGLLAPGTGSGTAEGAVLVAVQGNTYTTVAVLDFGSGGDDEGSGGRLPGLSSRYAIGDTSPLTRFVTGQEEALREYRGSEAARPEESDAATDPWAQDLFQRLQPPPSPARAGDADQPRESGLPEALLPTPAPGDAPEECFWDRCADEPLLLPATSGTGDAADVEALAVLLAAMLPAQGSEGSREPGGERVPRCSD
jgi:hypothetical protein